MSYLYKPRLLKMVWDMELNRTSEDQQLIIFKKDRNTPENKRDFEGDGSDGIQPISNIISPSLAGTDANGVVDLSSKLDDEISILRWNDSRISSVDTNYFDPPIPVTSKHQIYQNFMYRLQNIL